MNITLYLVNCACKDLIIAHLLVRVVKKTLTICSQESNVTI